MYINKTICIYIYAVNGTFVCFEVCHMSWRMFFSVLFLKPPWNHTANQRTNRSLQWRLGQLQRIGEQLRVWLGQREQFQWQWVQPSIPRCHTRGTNHLLLSNCHNTSSHWSMTCLFIPFANGCYYRCFLVQSIHYRIGPENMWKHIPF